MLKSLHLKNWRSIRNASIEFSPITVLIGANASGKTNVLDALYFLRDMLEKDVLQALYPRGLRRGHLSEKTFIWDKNQSQINGMAFKTFGKKA